MAAFFELFPAAARARVVSADLHMSSMLAIPIESQASCANNDFRWSSKGAILLSDQSR